MDPPQDTITTLTRFIDRMPSLSTTVTKVLEVCDRPNTAAADLNRVISLDPVLTAQVLKLINSAYYSLPNKITSLARAIIMLGLNTVKNLALSTAVIATLKQAGGGLPVDTFWSHCLATGVTARLLAGRLGIPASQREEYFVAGLLHDIGKLPLNACFPAEYGQALAVADLEEAPLLRSEQMVLACDHTVAGDLIAQRWQLGPAITAALRHHHDPAAAPAEQRSMATVVGLANLFANVYDYGSGGDRFPPPEDPQRLTGAAGITWPELAAHTATVAEEIDKARIFLQVGGGA